MIAICLQKNRIRRNKLDNKVKSDNKNIYFMHLHKTISIDDRE